MPVAKFQMPDGRIARFEVAEGTTPEQAQAQIQQMISAGLPEPVAAQPSPQSVPEQSLATTEQPTFAQALTGQRGSLPAAQAEAMGATSRESLAERERMLSSMPAERRALLESISPAEAALIGAGRGLTTIGRAVGLAEPETPSQKERFKELEKISPISTTVGEIAGESAPFLIPGVGIAGLGTRAAQVAGTAGLGALEAGLIARGKGEDIGTQLVSAGIGGTVAGALELAIPVIGRVGSKAVRRALGKAPKGAVVDAAGKPSQELVDALAESGQTYDDIIREVQDELSKQPIDPRQAARKAFFESQGVQPTKAQVTRNASDFQAQQEAAKVSGNVREALERQEAVLTSRFDNAILESGGNAKNMSATVADSITEKATKLDQAISELYSAARQTMPDQKNIRFDELTRILRELAPSDRRSGGNISAIVGDMKAKGILDDNMKVVGRVDVETAEDLRKLANELYDGKNPFGNMLLRKVKDKLDDDVFNAAGKDYFKQARKAKADFESELSRAKISKFDARQDNLVRDVLENKIDPDQLVDKVVFGKRWRPDDLQQLKSYISTDEGGKAAFDDMRAEVLDRIKTRSFIGPVDEFGHQSLSRDKLHRSMAAIGDKKLAILFDPKEIKFLKDMEKLAELKEPVRGTALGRGPSAQAILRLERKLKEMPMFGQVFEIIDIEGRRVLKAKPKQIRQPIALPAARGAAIAPAVAVTQPEEQQ